MMKQPLEVKFVNSDVLGIDGELCIGCGACMMMCSLYNEGVVSPALSRIRIARNPLDAEYEASICQQCLAPSCYVACPEADYALCFDEENGVKFINSDCCISCGACVQACPFDPKTIYTYPDSGIAYKCDLCADRPEGPICVEYCPEKALFVIKASERC